MGFRGLWVWLLIALLQGCGYALRGTTELPAEMNKVMIVGGSPQLQAAFRQVVIESGGTFAPGPGEANLVFRITGEETDRRFISLSATGKANEFENLLRVDYEVNKPDGESILPSQFVELSRDFFNNQVGIIGKFHEEGLLVNELYRQAAETILRQSSVVLTHGQLARK